MNTEGTINQDMSLVDYFIWSMYQSFSLHRTFLLHQVFCLSGTGSEVATIRVYIEQYEKYSSKTGRDSQEALAPLVRYCSACFHTYLTWIYFRILVSETGFCRLRLKLLLSSLRWKHSLADLPPQPSHKNMLLRSLTDLYVLTAQKNGITAVTSQ